jgi:hypothetical protein
VSNRRRLPRPSGGRLAHPASIPVTDRYEWLAAVTRDLNLTGERLWVAEAAALCADENGYFTDEDLYNALEVLGHPVYDRYEDGTR